jgi:aminoglycoside phosphotransferase (APT) family kinase protein
MLPEPPAHANPAAPPATDREISSRLLTYLRAELQRPSLAYEKSPERLAGGFENTVFVFALTGAPETSSGPLVLRIFSARPDSERATVEATVHNALAAMGYPAPRVCFVETDPSILGSAFIIMERKRGRTLAEEFQGLGGGRSIRELLRLLSRVPRMLREFSLLVEAQYRLHQLPSEPLARALEEQGLLERVTFDGRMNWLRDLTRQPALAGLVPGVAWLESHRVTDSRSAICHCDFQPFNILSENGQLTGVLDWGNVTIADPEIDVAATIANIMTVPLKVPAPFQALFRFLMNLSARHYYRSYCRLNVLDGDAVRYYQVFRCMVQLAWVADGVSNSRPSRGVFDSPEGIARLVAYVQHLTGLKLHFDARFP